MITIYFKLSLSVKVCSYSILIMKFKQRKNLLLIVDVAVFSCIVVIYVMLCKLIVRLSLLNKWDQNAICEIKSLLFHTLIFVLFDMKFISKLKISKDFYYYYTGRILNMNSFIYQIHWIEHRNIIFDQPRWWKDNIGLWWCHSTDKWQTKLDKEFFNWVGVIVVLIKKNIYLLSIDTFYD